MGFQAQGLRGLGVEGFRGCESLSSVLSISPDSISMKRVVRHVAAAPLSGAAVF